VKIDELKKAKDQRPFQPFHVRMADGREIQVTHPDAVAWHPDTPAYRRVYCAWWRVGNRGRRLDQFPRWASSR